MGGVGWGGEEGLRQWGARSPGDKKLGRRKSFELKNQKDSRDSSGSGLSTFEYKTPF